MPRHGILSVSVFFVSMVLGFLLYLNLAIKTLLIHLKNSLGVCTQHLRLLLYRFVTRFGTVRHSLRPDVRFGFKENITYFPSIPCESV